MSNDLTALLERVRNATGPDRRLNIYLHVLLNNDGRLGDYASVDEYANSAIQLGWNTPAYTASVDAALALVERVLPGCGLAIDREPPAKGGAAAGAAVNGWIGEDGPDGRAWEHFDATGPTFPLAILTALLLALTSNQEGNDEA